MSYNASFVSALKEALNGLKTVHQVGEEWVSYVGDIPTGGVPYCGQEVNRSTYSALWEYANAKGLVKSESEWQSLYNAQGGNVAFYSSGNGSSTFRMPRLVGYVRGASSQSESGSYVKEGLPNITGTLNGLRSSAGKKAAYEGALSWDSLDETYPNQVVSKTDYDYGSTGRLDASRSNAIYGNSVHVTPKTSVVLYGVYAFGEIGNVSALDAGTLANAISTIESNLDTKLDDDDKAKIARWGMPDWTAGISIDIPTESAPYTVPCDGFYVYCYSFDPASARSFLYVNGKQTSNCMSNSDGSRANKSSVCVALLKGDVIYVSQSGFTKYASKFYPVLGR